MQQINRVGLTTPGSIAKGSTCPEKRKKKRKKWKPFTKTGKELAINKEIFEVKHCLPN